MCKSVGDILAACGGDNGVYHGEREGEKGKEGGGRMCASSPHEHLPGQVSTLTKYTVYTYIVVLVCRKPPEFSTCSCLRKVTFEIFGLIYFNVSPTVFGFFTDGSR